MSLSNRISKPHSRFLSYMYAYFPPLLEYRYHKLQQQLEWRVGFLCCSSHLPPSSYSLSRAEQSRQGEYYTELCWMSLKPCWRPEPLSDPLMDQTRTSATILVTSTHWQLQFPICNPSHKHTFLTLSPLYICLNTLCDVLFFAFIHCLCPHITLNELKTNPVEGCLKEFCKPLINSLDKSIRQHWFF